MTGGSNPMGGYAFLAGMYRDGYFPDVAVDMVKAVLVNLCETLAAQPPNDLAALYVLTHGATEEINELEAEFDARESELETVAREVIAADFEAIATAFGFPSADVEELIAPRDW